jgi:hypothetical protein
MQDVRRISAAKDALARIDRALDHLVGQAAQARDDETGLDWPRIGDLNHVAAVLEEAVTFWGGEK